MSRRPLTESESGYQPLYDAMAYLASQCDGAITKDGVGFNGQDTKYGHRVVDEGVENWNEITAAEVSRILPTYRNQLSFVGIDINTLPLVQGEDNRHEARSQARQSEYKRNHQPYITVDGSLVKVWNSFPIKDDLKANGFAFGKNGTKTWDAPINGHSASTILAVGEIELTPTQREDLEALSKDYTPTPVSKPVNITVSPENPNKLWIVTDSSTWVPVNIMRAVPGRKWLGHIRTNEVDPTPEVLTLADTFKLTIDDAAKAAIEIHRSEYEQFKAEQEASVADSRAIDTDVEVSISDHLYAFQRAGVAYALSHIRTLIGDDMGLGKTRQALSAMETKNAYPALVICPANLKLNWEREIKMLLPHRTVTVYNGRNNDPDLKMTSDISVVGWPTVQFFIQNLPGLRAMVCDESHYMKNEKAGRTKAVLEIVGKGFDEERMPIPSRLTRDALVLMLTGTPILNRPVELVQPLRAMGYLVDVKGELRPGMKTVGQFLYRYCDPKKNGWGTTFNGHSNEMELHQWLREICMVRRTKDQVLTQLPPKVRAPQFIALPDAAQRKYEYLAKLGAEKAAQSRAEALVYLNELRKAIGTAKIEFAIEWIEEFLETGKQLIVFADHINVQNSIADALLANKVSVARIAGARSNSFTESEKGRFQRGEARVIVCSLKAGIEGHTLTAASDVLFVEMGWNPATHDQGEDRSYRIGQNESVTSWWLVAQNTHDEDTYELIDSKRKVINAVHDGKTPEDDEVSIFNALLERTIGRYGR